MNGHMPFLKEIRCVFQRKGATVDACRYFGLPPELRTAACPDGISLLLGAAPELTAWLTAPLLPPNSQTVDSSPGPTSIISAMQLRLMV